MTPPPTAPPFPTEPPPPHHPTGNGDIYDTAGGENPTANMIRTLNFWQGTLGGQKVYVFAGAVKETPAQGMILLQVWPPSGEHSGIQLEGYGTPTQAGWVRVTDVTGARLTLRASSGATFIFDLTTRQWVGLTPGPSPSPGLSPLPSPSP